MGRESARREAEPGAKGELRKQSATPLAIQFSLSDRKGMSGEREKREGTNEDWEAGGTREAGERKRLRSELHGLHTYMDRWSTLLS